MAETRSRKTPASAEPPRKKARASETEEVEEIASSTEAISKENEGGDLEQEETETAPSNKATVSRTRFGKGPIVKKAKVWKRKSSPEATTSHAGRRSAREELEDVTARLEEIVARFLRTVQGIREEIKRIAEARASSL